MDGETANGSLDQLIFIRSYVATWITVVILELIHALKLSLAVGDGGAARVLLLGQNQRATAFARGRRSQLVTLDNFPPIARPRAGDVSFKCLPYQVSKVGAMLTLLITGNGESGFDSGEGA